MAVICNWRCVNLWVNKPWWGMHNSFPDPASKLEASRSFGRSAAPVLPLALLALLSGVAPVSGQTYLLQTNVTEAAPATPSTIAGSPGTGASGAAGSVGSYNCDQMSWGSACARFGGFGTFSTVPATNGSNAPLLTLPTMVAAVGTPAVLSATGTATSAGVTIVEVVGLASGRVRSTAESSAQPTDVLNAGAAFNVVITQGATTITSVMAAKSTLRNVVDAINGNVDNSGRVFASIVSRDVTVGGTTSTVYSVKLEGVTGVANDFTVQLETPASPPTTTTPTPLSLSALDFVNTSSSPVDAQYKLDGGSVQTSSSNTVSLPNRLSVGFRSVGTSTVTAALVSAGAATAGLPGVGGGALAALILRRV